MKRKSRLRTLTDKEIWDNIEQILMDANSKLRATDISDELHERTGERISPMHIGIFMRDSCPYKYKGKPWEVERTKTGKLYSIKEGFFKPYQ